MLSVKLKQWAGELAAASDTPRLEAEILVKQVTGISNAQLITRSNQALHEKDIQQIQALVAARLKGEPIAYLVGRKEFYSLELSVDQSVLIPRPETELLVDLALEFMQQHRVNKALDLGTGSGAVALAMERAMAASSGQAGLTITAIEREASSLALAKQNARHLGVHNVRFMQSDWFTEIKHERFDLIVSNPPYIAEQDPHLQQGDLRFEPSAALVAKDNGLADLAHIIQNAPDYLTLGGGLMLEHGFDQASAVQALLRSAGFSQLQTHKDLNGLHRVSTGVFNG